MNDHPRLREREADEHTDRVERDERGRVAAECPGQQHRNDREDDNAVRECEAIALAKELNAVLLVDEHEARREAHRLGIEYMGSLRVLKEAKARGIIPEIKPILDEIIVAGTYISDTLYQAFLSEVDEA